MLTDPTAATYPDDVETDICVVGAGPAGIAFAREYVGSSLRVCLVESGWFQPDERVDSLSTGQVDSRHYRPSALEGGRRRQFGGTSNMWGYQTEPASGRLYARSVPPEPGDLAERSWQPGGGWPLSMDDLRSYYVRAQSVWSGGPFDYAVSSWADPATRPACFDTDTLTTRISQHGPNDVFTLRYRDDLVSAPNIEVLLGTTVVRLESDRPGPVVRQARVVGADGSSFPIRAKAFVLAAGGVENVQLLLLSEATAAGGIGNAHDNAGHYVTDHPEFRMGTVTPAQHSLLDEIGLYDLHWSGQHMINGFLTLAEQVKDQEQLLNVSVALAPQPAGFGSAAERSMRALLGARQRGKPPAVQSHLRTILQSPGDTAAVLRSRLPGRSPYNEYQGGWSRPDADRRRFSVIELHAATEQTAQRTNRITLSERRDRLGRRAPKLEWQWSAEDQENVRRSLRLIAAEIESTGLGKYSPWVDFNGPVRPVYAGLHHPMGGTRMHVDPAQGVVDAACRVHGMDNVYVAGSSVFPTGHGYANPTLTLLALAIRLADHTKARLA